MTHTITPTGFQRLQTFVKENNLLLGISLGGTFTLFVVAGLVASLFLFPLAFSIMSFLGAGIAGFLALGAIESALDYSTRSEDARVELIDRDEHGCSPTPFTSVALLCIAFPLSLLAVIVPPVGVTITLCTSALISFSLSSRGSTNLFEMFSGAKASSQPGSNTAAADQQIPARPNDQPNSGTAQQSSDKFLLLNALRNKSSSQKEGVSAQSRLKETDHHDAVSKSSPAA